VCDNAAALQLGTKLAFAALLSGVALACATVTPYWFSIWWCGGRAYYELIAPVCVGIAASTATALLIGIILRKQRGVWSIVRASAILACAFLLARD
jgi:hypothetical protein